MISGDCSWGGTKGEQSTQVSALLSFSFILFQFLFHSHSMCLKFEFSFIVFHLVSSCFTMLHSVYFLFHCISSSFTVYNCVFVILTVLYLFHYVSWSGKHLKWSLRAQMHYNCATSRSQFQYHFILDTFHLWKYENTISVLLPNLCCKD